MFRKDDVVQFTEKHKWCGSLGIIREVKACGDDKRYMVGVPIPEKGTAFIYVMESECVIELIGTAHLLLKEDDNR